MMRRDIYKLVLGDDKLCSIGTLKLGVMLDWSWPEINSLLTRVANPIHQEVYEVLTRRYIHERTADLR